MTIKKINLNEIEDFLKEIVESSTQIKIFKEENEDVKENLNSNKMKFKSGKISNEVYKDIKNNLEKEKKLLENKISENKNSILVISKKLSENIENSKI